MQSDKDWIEDIIEHTIENYNNRDVVIWGKYNVSELLADRLKRDHNINVVFFVDSDIEKQNGTIVYPPEILKKFVGKIFIIVPLSFHKSISDYIKDLGFISGKDYYYFCDCIIKQTEMYYEDEHGNRFIGNRNGVKFSFSGYNSTIKLGTNVRLNHPLYVHNNVHIDIGDNCDLWETSINVENNGALTLGKNAIIYGAEINLDSFSILCVGDDTVFGGSNKWVQRIFLREKSRINIGNRTTIAGRYHIFAHPYTEIRIGEDCMFSWGCSVFSDDGHAIFDINNGTRLNSYKHRKVTVGNHVWIGLNCTLLYNCKIGNGCIVGAHSLCKKEYPNNCMIVGSPAKLIRKNVAWARDNNATDIDACGGYVDRTTDIIK